MAANSSPVAVASAQVDSRKQQIRAAQVRLLYSNVNVGALVTLVAATVLARLQWGVVPHGTILGWSVYTFLVSVCIGKFTLARFYWRAAPSSLEASRWGAAFTIGAALAGAGWG